ncbi:MAG: cobyric acid synthase [Peptococcaceae bacterium]|jgi:adenosylcobyric acid synthase|nr:cobyric acid synthase [Peptococcaceae bacterium]MDH7525796.1 cobyric acid synthase [Peptococcaceae bacterium]
MTARAIMIQGTGSSVGKSLLVTALCRIFKQDGYRVAPFKAQNMALNSYITVWGEEMGRAQVVQAEACGIPPSALMNPILLKPTSDKGAQVICLGRVYKNMAAGEYHHYKPELKEMVLGAYRRLAGQYEIIVIEGAGSPAEINLREADLVNMGMAEMAGAPVILVGDIDRGGVFAWLAGTMLLLTESEKARVKGIIINKFRGDEEILKPGLKMLEDIVKVPVLGVVPYLDHNIDDEDSVTEEFYRREAGEEREISVEVLHLPYMSNFTDFNVLRHFPDVSLRYINRGGMLGKPDLLLIPGSKNTLADLLYLRESGMERQILDYHERGGLIIGICGGYQMLGKTLRDPHFTESTLGEIEGMGLLDMSTVIEKDKTTAQAEAVVVRDDAALLEGLRGQTLEGYEIHMGISAFGPAARPFTKITKRSGKDAGVMDGVTNREGTVFGTYLHGIFDNTAFTRKLVNNVRKIKGLPPVPAIPPSRRELKEREYDRLADVVRRSLDMRALYAVWGKGNED